MRKVLYSTALTAALIGGWAYADDVQGVKDAKWTLTGNPQTVLQEFIDKFHDFNQGEIRMSEMAATKATNPQVKEFANQAVRDHRELDQKLSEFAKRKNMAFTADSGKFDRLSDIACKIAEQHCAQKMSNLSGAEFDKYYMFGQKGGHMWAKSLLQAAHQYLPDQEGRELAKGFLASIDEHSQHIDRICKQLERGGGEQR